MASIDELANTLRGVATSGMKPKALLAAVRERHPEATKKEIVRAAFYALTEGPNADLHAFALTERAVDEEEPVKGIKLRKKKKDRKAKLAGQAAH